MSTRCLIGKLNDDDSVTAIYCQLDSSPEHVGGTLCTSYQHERDVDALLALGDLSSLGLSTYGGDTQAYHRDMGDAFESHHYPSEEDYHLDSDTFSAQYVYLYKEGVWHVSGIVDEQWVYMERIIEVDDSPECMDDERGQCFVA